MKKVSVIGITDDEFVAVLLPVLGRLRAAFMVEHIEDDEPPKPPPQQPQHIPWKPSRPGSQRKKKAEPGQRLEDFVLRWLNEAGGRMKRDLIKTKAEAIGFKATSVNPLLGDMKSRGVIVVHYDDGTVEKAKKDA